MKNNKIVLSIVVSSLLFSQSYALPSGGKFTHGTSGTINVNGNTMNITGNKVNSVIQWGGGFNIAKGETVNFRQGKTNQNYLNIAYGTKSSTIDGLLNATGNNVYLINPNGVVIGKSGTINANKFGVSTSSIDSKAMQEFADRSTFESPVFSPKFTANKGNVINMGNIKANDVLIIGNEVGNVGADGVGNFNLQDNGKVQFVGDKVKVNVRSIKNANSIIVSAQTAATLRQSTTDVYKNNTNNLDSRVQAQNYNGLTNYLQTIQMTKKTTIANVEDWAYFAKGINEGKTGMKSVDTFDLISDIDFGANCNSEGVCTGQNYANFNVAGNSELQGVNMIVRKDDSHVFYANFNGNGHTLSNINIDTTVRNDINNTGLFGYIGDDNSNNSVIKDLTVDYKGGGIKSNSYNAGGFTGNTYGTFTNISLNNIGNIDGGDYIGGFAGEVGDDDKFININLNNIGNMSGNSKLGTYVGGFIGYLRNISGYTTFSNIYIFLNKNTEIISDGSDGSVGLFVALNANKLNKPDNIHIYKYNTDFTDSNKYVDNGFWNLVSGFDDAGQDGKINIHSYIEQASANENFKNVVLDKLKDMKKIKMEILSLLQILQ
ncbi:filamentous hemagglutinin N-terminal domain-containing protein [Campylobacter jejuni]|uniref:two-partner secretion domain-containing protein n=1 Tax=Campylobacter TaxID=194 RepID=UPI000AC6AB86|nr:MULTISPECIES: filamentous hemagglutinin N-terminal domain-containing protein [Campylobacter]KAJ9921406.1 filamentous hemagglutinin N-terminal domain-containing protein [Campylobacter jejuni]KAJ9930846.1 filamentous hemagglutinin N-terminal domain-containing protein [Campylobacter jejuni]KAJ9931773.1 filamentous hemagglutinin N-terminal domain-containing protein [Campylobacter jejuni]MCC3006505.1 filamentous hemagglutinin N-terminal domain-containing protein [Campylobacter jejuni]MCC3040776.